MMKRLWKVLRFALGAMALAFVIVQLWFYGHILYWSKYPVGSTRFMDAKLAALQDKNPKARLFYRWTDYRHISIHLKRAVVAAEDDKFIDHEGFDWEGIQRAIEKNEKKGKAVAGGSTITQQLAKNLFLSGERSYIRKGEEAIITLMLESTLSKRRILELYLNVAEWGNGIFGAEAAARHYYGVSASQLSAWQAARLAAMLPRPQFYHRNPGSDYLSRYSERILLRMNHAQVP